MNNERLNTMRNRIENVGLEDEGVDEGLVAEIIDELIDSRSRIATLTAERDEARKQVETLKADDKSNTAMSDRCNRVMRVLRDSGNADAESAFWIIAGDARDSRETITRLTAELAALKSCPAMAEVDALMEAISEAPNLSPRMKSAALKGADIARRSIASREEVVELLDHILSCIITVRQENTPEWMEYIAEEVNKVNEAMGDPDRAELIRGRILLVKSESEIVEGNHA